MRENAARKAARYLAEGRLTVERVDETTVRATCRGSGAVYDVGWSPSAGWSCNCPAIGLRCAHVLALQAVVVRSEGQT